MNRTRSKLVPGRSATLASCAALAALWLGACGEDENPTGSQNPLNPDGGAAATTTGTMSATTSAAPAATGTTGATTGATGTTTGGATGMTTAGTTGEPAAGVELPSCEVAGIFQKSCQTCHGEELTAGAPMPLVTYEDYQGMGVINPDKTIISLIGERIHDEMMPMPPLNDPGTLTDEEKAAIDAWIADGAPSNMGQSCGGDTSGGATEGNDGTPKGVWPPPDADECYTILSHGNGGLDTPHIVKAGTETHPQIIYDAPWGDEKVQAVGFRPITDNKKVLHHWIIYENGGAASPFIVGWAPGTPDSDLPEDVGMYLPSGPDSLRLDMHYYNSTNPEDEEDMSGVEICVAKANTRPETATVFMGFSNIIGLRVPPQSETDITAYCTITGNQPITTMSVSPHMHELGTRAKMEVKRADGTIEVWHDEAFAFEDQKVWDLEQQVLMPGDEVKTTCSYRNDTNATVTFGENTGDEMCFNFVTYYPKDGFTCGANLFATW